MISLADNIAPIDFNRPEFGHQLMMTPRYKCSILAVDDEPAVLDLLEQQIGEEFHFHRAESAEQARKIVDAQSMDLILTDLQLTDSSGLHLLDWACQYHPRMARILVTGAAKLEDTIDAVNRCHVQRIILKPWRGQDLLLQLRDVSRSLLLERSHEKLLEELRVLNQELENRVEARTHDLNQLNQELEKIALTDSLTSLPNRRAIEFVATQEINRLSRSLGPIAFGLIDADHFKNINSRFLLSGGDVVLMNLAQVLKRTIRSSDSVGRIGGEEFMVVAPDTDFHGTEILAERIRDAVENSQTIYRGERIQVTVSIGFAIADAGSQVDSEHLREAAAEALSEAKNMGRNCIVVRRFTESNCYQDYLNTIQESANTSLAANSTAHRLQIP